MEPPARHLRQGTGISHRTRPIVVYLIALAALAVASRLPSLLSPNVLADGDESVLGLMAKHVLEGKEFPIFFYGQNYAFEPVETTTAAISFLVLGAGPMALKLAGLGLWTAGVWFLFLALAHHVGAARSFWIAAALILNPAWAVWSLREGGGYLTAFTATGLLLWVITRDRPGGTVESVVRWLIAGVLTAIIYLAQPLWLPGLLSILLVMLALRPRLLPAACYLAATAAAIAVVKIATPAVADTWVGPSLGNSDLAGSLPLVARQIYVHFTGSYYLGWSVDSPGSATTAVAIVWCALLIAAVALQGYRLLTRRYCPLSHVLFAAVGSTVVAEWMLLSARDARYLLPLGGLLVPLIGVELIDLVDRQLVPKAAAVALTSIVLLLGSLSMLEYRRFNYLWPNPETRLSEARRLQQVLTYLKTVNVRHVFSMNGLLDTQITFYSNEQVVARWTHPVGKYHPYVQEVNRALAAGEPVAVVGYTHTSGAPGCSDVPICTGGLETMVADPWRIFTVDGKYFVYVGATRELLAKLGFRFWD